ncbi:hypothetical protein MMC29_002231 [Sticta canariensis]|nr:hypothetical protein [Sticta canariensis]
MPSLSFRPLLEIEQKFHLNTTLLPLFRANLGVPPFRSIIHRHPATSSFRDIYYDDKGRKLEKEGIWLRKREGKGWEVKQRLASAKASPLLLSARGPTGGGEDGSNNINNATTSTMKNENNTYLRSTFLELNSPASIHDLIRTHFGPNTPGPEHNFGLEVLCDFRTEREQATVDDDFDVVLDQTSFGHAVGEVELIAGRAGSGADDDPGKGHQRIDDFMRKYAWFFGGGEGGRRKKVKGKLSAYFERFGEGGRAKENWQKSNK